MDTMATTSTTSFTPAQPVDMANFSRLQMVDPIVSAVLALFVFWLVLARTARLPSGSALWAARFVLTGIIAFVLGWIFVPNIWQLPWGPRQPGLGFAQVGMLFVGYTLTIVVEWALTVLSKASRPT